MINLKESKPIFIENSKVPAVLSKVAPINISAITLGLFVFSREAINETTRRHETIHWQQYIETLIIGFLFLYLLFWLYGLIKYRGDGKKAYAQIPFEQEAYHKDIYIDYLEKRKRFTWLKYKV